MLSQTVDFRRLQTLDQLCRAILVEVQYEKDDPNINEKESIYLKCELPDDKSYRVTSANFDFINDNFIKGPYKSAETLMRLGPDTMIDLDKLEIISLHGDKPVLSNMKDEQHNMFGRRRQLATTTGIRSVLVVRVVASVSFHILSNLFTFMTLLSLFEPDLAIFFPHRMVALHTQELKWVILCLGL